MNVNDIYTGGSTLKATDLQGHTVRVSVASFEVKKFENGNKIILKFVGKEKGLVVNKTNAMILQSAYGPSVEGWVGKQIEIFPDKTNFAGEIKDCIRVRVPAPAAVAGQEPTW